MRSKETGLRVPAAERLAGTLLGRIERGEYPPGQWLPTERELAAEFQADRSTIRIAISSLAERRRVARGHHCLALESAGPGPAKTVPAPDTAEGLPLLA